MADPSISEAVASMLGNEQRLTVFLRQNAGALARFDEVILVIQGLRQQEFEASPMASIIQETAPQARRDLLRRNRQQRRRQPLRGQRPDAGPLLPECR